MTMKDDARKAQAMQLRTQINRLRKQAEGAPSQSAKRDPLLVEILETLGRFEEQMEEITNRLDRLEKNR